MIRPNSEILDRTPPHDLEAEANVIGSVLLDPRTIDAVAAIVSPGDFYADANRKLLGHLIGMHDANVPIDTTLLVARLKRAGDFEAIGGAAYLAEVAQSVPLASHATFYAEIVAKHAARRRMILAALEAVPRAMRRRNPRKKLRPGWKQRSAALTQRTSAANRFRLCKRPWPPSSGWTRSKLVANTRGCSRESMTLTRLSAGCSRGN